MEGDLLPINHQHATRAPAPTVDRPPKPTPADRLRDRHAAAAGTASRGVVWPAAEPSLTDRHAEVPAPIPQPGGPRGRGRRADAARAPIARRATPTTRGRRPGAHRPRAARRPASPSTDRRRGSRRCAAVRGPRPRGRRASRSGHRRYRRTRCRPRPTPTRLPSRSPATGAVTRTSDAARGQTRYPSFGFDRLVSWPSTPAHLDPRAGAERTAVGAQAAGDADPQRPAAVVDLERDRPARRTVGPKRRSRRARPRAVPPRPRRRRRSASRARRAPAPCRANERLRDSQRFHAAERRPLSPSTSTRSAERGAGRRPRRGGGGSRRSRPARLPSARRAGRSGASRRRGCAARVSFAAARAARIGVIHRRSASRRVRRLAARRRRGGDAAGGVADHVAGSTREHAIAVGPRSRRVALTGHAHEVECRPRCPCGRVDPGRGPDDDAGCAAAVIDVECQTGRELGRAADDRRDDANQLALEGFADARRWMPRSAPARWRSRGSRASPHRPGGCAGRIDRRSRR